MKAYRDSERLISCRWLRGNKLFRIGNEKVN